MLVVAPAAVRVRAGADYGCVYVIRVLSTGVVVYFDTFKYKFTTSRYHASAKFRGKWSEAPGVDLYSCISGYIVRPSLPRTVQPAVRYGRTRLARVSGYSRTKFRSP